VARVDKLTKLIAVFDQFYTTIGVMDNPLTKQLAGNWENVRKQCISAEGVPRSAVAAGMEQGLRETPILLGSMQPETRKEAAHALAAAITAHFPEFFAKDAVRLDKIKIRGFIRSESEFYLVRHHVDILEGESGREAEIAHCCELIDRFEARDK